MDLKRALIPAVAGIFLFLGCESKPKDVIPAQAPAPIKAGEEHRILDWLRYVGVRKDLKAAAAISISGIDPKVAGFDNYRWLHQHAGSVGQSLTLEEITAFGLQDMQNLGVLVPGVSKKDLQDALNKVATKPGEKLPDAMVGLNEAKVDEIPGSSDKSRAVEFEVAKGLEKAIGDAGVYRIAAAMPEGVWQKVTIQAVKPQPANANFIDVFIQFQTKLVLQVTLTKRTDGNMGIVYAYYSATRPTFLRWDEKLKKGESFEVAK